MNITEKNLLGIQALVLLGGTIFAWSKLILQFDNFYSLYGTFLRFNDITIPNPLTTACFYGSLAFLVALFWSARMYQDTSHRSERLLRNFLLFCVVFAVSVFAYELIVFYKLFGFHANAFICTPGVHPTQTPCFYGMLFFIVAFITSVVATRRLKPDTKAVIW